MNLEEQYDAIVVGTGISGGWDAWDYPLCPTCMGSMALLWPPSCLNPSLTYMAFTCKGGGPCGETVHGREVCLNRTEQPYIRTDVLVNRTKEPSRSYISHQ